MAVSGIYSDMKHKKKWTFLDAIGNHNNNNNNDDDDGNNDNDDNNNNDDDDDDGNNDNDDNDDNDDDCGKQENFLLVNCDKGIEDQIIFEASLPKNNKITICDPYRNVSISPIITDLDGTFNIIDNKNNKIDNAEIIANAKIITKEEKEKKEKEEEEFKKAFIEDKKNREDAKKKIYDFLLITKEEKEEIESIKNTKLRVIGNNGGKRNSVRRKKNKKSKTIKTVYRKKNLQSSRKSRKSRKH
jgi:hypothetical protein